MIDIKIENLEQLMKAYGNVGNIVRKEMKDALNKSSAVVEREAKRRTPVDLGHLRRSIQKTKRVSAGDKKVYVGSNVKYARRQHEGINFKHTTGEAKFLENALERKKSTIIRYFKEMINNIINKLARYK
jgi:HK97 gp10 family phage protein